MKKESREEEGKNGQRKKLEGSGSPVMILDSLMVVPHSGFRVFREGEKRDQIKFQSLPTK